MFKAPFRFSHFLFWLLAMALFMTGHWGESFAAEPSKPSAKAAQAQAAQPVQPAPPPANYTDAGRETGVDINAKMTAWNNELDRIENELEGQRVRYKELER